MTISGFAAYVKQLWKNKPDVSTPLSAERLLHMEDGIKMTSDAIEAIAAAVVSQITNDPNKIASMAALYTVNQKIGNVANLPNNAADVVTAIAQQNSNLNGYKIYNSLADIGITSNTTTLNAVMVALKNKGPINSFIFFFSQGSLTTGITDLPISYGLLTVIGAGGRVRVRIYSNDRVFACIANTNDMVTITADDLHEVPEKVVDALTGNATADHYKALSAYQGYLLNQKFGNIQILSIATLNVGTTTSAADGATWSNMNGTITAVSGATGYYFIPLSCNFGFVTRVSVSGTTVTCSAMNASGGSHSCAIVGLVVAYKKLK